MVVIASFGLVIYLFGVVGVGSYDAFVHKGDSPKHEHLTWLELSDYFGTITYSLEGSRFFNVSCIF